MECVIQVCILQAKLKNSFSIQIYCQEVETKKVVAMEVGMKAQVHYYKKGQKLTKLFIG